MAKIKPGKNSSKKDVITHKAAALFKKKGYSSASMRELDTTENSAGNTVSILESIIRFHIRMMLNNFDEVYVANHEWKHLKEPYLSNFLIQRRGYEKRLIALVENGILEKTFKNNNPYVSVLTILSAVRGLEFWQQHKKNISSQILEDDMVNHLLKGIIK